MIVAQLFYRRSPPCLCRSVESECLGCLDAMWVQFCRGWSWVAVGCELAATRPERLRRAA